MNDTVRALTPAVIVSLLVVAGWFMTRRPDDLLPNPYVLTRVCNEAGVGNRTIFRIFEEAGQETFVCTPSGWVTIHD